MNAITPFLSIIVAAGLLLPGSGCASKPTVKPGFNFSGYRTFAVLPPVGKGTYEDPGLMPRLSRPVQETVGETLAAKGFKPAKETEADFLVQMLFDYRPDQGRFEDRMFDLRIIDRQSKEIVWSDFWHRKTDKTLPEHVIREVVADMLKPFPPGSQTPGR